MGDSSDSQVLPYVIPAILIASLLISILLCIRRVRRLRAQGLHNDSSTSATSHQRPVGRTELRHVVQDARSPHRSWGWSFNRRPQQPVDVEHGLAAFRLIPIRANRAAHHHAILQPTYIATPRGTLAPGALEQVSGSRSNSSPVVSASLPPLPHTPPPPYNEALQGNGRNVSRQTWL